MLFFIVFLNKVIKLAKEPPFGNKPFMRREHCVYV